MKLFVYAAALLPLAGAFQPNLSRGQSLASLSMYRPDLNWDAGKNDIDEPLSNLVPDCTKQETVSVLNKGTYEALNGHRTPEYRMPPQSRLPPRCSPNSLPPQARPPVPMGPSIATGSAYGDYFLPDPANNPSNPLATNQYASRPFIGTDRAPDQPPEAWHRL